MSGSNGRGYSFRISAEGMREFSADMRRLSAESDGVQQAFSKLVQASPDLANSLLRAEEVTKRATDSARQLREANERAAAAAANLPGSLSRATDGFGRLESQALGARRAVADFRGAIDLVGAGALSSALGPVSGYLGNVADLFGTASLASTAFGGSAASLTSLLGPLAAAVGLVGGAAYALSASYEAVNRRQEEVRAGEDAYRRAMELSAEVLRTNNDLAQTAAARKRQEAIAANENAVAIERENLARANEAASRAAATRARLEEVAASGRDVSSGLGRARTAELGIANAAEAISQRIAEAEVRLTQLRLTIYDEPIGPPAPTRAPTEARAQRGDDAITRMVNRAVEQEQERLKRAKEQIARDEARMLQERQRLHERTTDSITRYLADGFADAFRDTGRGFEGMLRAMRDAAISTPIRIVADAVLRPIVSAGVNALGGMGGGGGLTGMLGLSGLGSQISGALGLGGMGGGLSGVLNTTVIGASGPIGPTLSGAAMGGGASLGQLLGGVGLGFGAGTMLNGLLGGNQTGGMIGSGGGAIAGAILGSTIFPGVGTVLGGLIGGAGGGALGGLFGGGRGGTFYNAAIGSSGGRLSLDSVTGKNAAQQMAALQQQAAAEIQAINAQLDALGLTVSGWADVGQGVGGAQQFGSVAAAGSRFRLSAQDLRIQGAIDRAGGTLDALGAAQEAGAFVAQIDAMRQAVDDAADPIGAIRRQFDAMRETALRLGFGLDEVNAAQERAIQQRRQSAAGTAAGLIGGIADYARTLRTANDNSGNPLSRLAAADSQFSRTIEAALGGDIRALGRVTQDAQTFRGASREVFGTGQGFADAEGRIVAALERVGLVGDDQLTASALAAETRSQTETLVAALARLQDEVAALRRDARQAATNPLVARVA